MEEDEPPMPAKKNRQAHLRRGTLAASPPREPLRMRSTPPLPRGSSNVSLSPDVRPVWPPDWHPATRMSTEVNGGPAHAVCTYGRDSMMLSCGEDGTLRRMDLRTGALVGDTKKAHEGSVYDCCVFPNDDPRVLTCGKDGALRLWRLPDELNGDIARVEECGGAHTIIPYPDGRPIKSCSVFTARPDEHSPSKVLCLTASACTLKVWDLGDLEKPFFKCLLTIPTPSAHDLQSCCVFTSQSGEIHALTAGRDENVRLWKLADKTDSGEGVEPRVLRQDLAGKAEITHADREANDQAWLARHNPVSDKDGHTGIVRCCVVSEDATRALSCSGDHRAIYWDLTAGEALRVLHRPSDAAVMVTCCFLQQSTLALTVSGDAPRLWDVNSGELLRTFCWDDTHSSQQNVLLQDECGLIACCYPVSGGTKVLACDHRGTIRLLDLSQTDNMAALQKNSQEDSHTHIVKDVCVFQDQEPMAISCSYDETAIVWSLRTGECKAILKGHKDRVYQCCAFPSDEDREPVRRVLTGSGDGTIRIWDWRNQECELIISHLEGLVVTEEYCAATPEMRATPEFRARHGLGHIREHEQQKVAVRGCGVFDDKYGRKVYSCSEDSTICLFELEFHGGDHPSAQLKYRLEGHSKLIDRCAVYGNDEYYMISASWDHTCKVWDLETGKEVHTLESDSKVRGVVVYKDGTVTKAATAGSGRWLEIWNLDTGIRLKQLDMNHDSTVWGLSMLNENQQLAIDGRWQSAPAVATYSNDGTIKVWHLFDGYEREVVHARRAVHPSPMCVAVAPRSFHMGALAILVGAHRSLRVFDMSHLGTGPSAGVIWAGRSCTTSSRWNRWIQDAIAEDSAYCLYARDQMRESQTMIHMLAAKDGGQKVIADIVEHFNSERAMILDGQRHNPMLQKRALGTIGMLSRAGTSKGGSALDVAITKGNEEMVQVLLRDYQDHITMIAHSFNKTRVPAPHLRDLTEGELVNLFHMFPSAAADFLVTCPLIRTNLVDPDAKCDFSICWSGRFCRASMTPSPQAVANKGTRWWDPLIDSIHKLFSSAENASRFSGTPAVSERVPIKAGFYDDELDFLRGRFPTAFPDSAGAKATGTKYLQGLASCSCPALQEQKEQCDESETGGDNRKLHPDTFKRPTFSYLLEVCLQYSRTTGNPEIFMSPSVQAIIDYKWGVTYPMYKIFVAEYVVYVLLFTLTTVKFRVWALSSDSQLKAAGYVVHTATLCLMSTLFRHEFLEGLLNPGGYFREYFNWWDLMSLTLSFVSLITVAYEAVARQRDLVTYSPTAETQDPNDCPFSACTVNWGHVIRVIRALALATSWCNCLQWFLGMTRAFFFVRVMIDSIWTMSEIFVIYTILIAAFSFAFNELLGKRNCITHNGLSGPFDELTAVFRTTLGMTFGDFDSDMFIDQTSASPRVSFALFAIFMIVITIIMMNLLIAGE